MPDYVRAGVARVELNAEPLLVAGAPSHLHSRARGRPFAACGRDEELALEILRDALERGVAAPADEAGDLLAARIWQVGEVLGVEVWRVTRAA